MKKWKVNINHILDDIAKKETKTKTAQVQLYIFS